MNTLAACVFAFRGRALRLWLPLLPGRPTPTSSTAKEFLTGSKRREKFLQADWQVNLTSSSDSTV
ncbi:hypothetical protein M5K25_012314 [Dendrobium thyrsiflorum]|uniref:Uncharacterized protein n=1 Tax=Dendrobium thyrsiflorum TaxID=117978 RepID=A0ABD0UX92_DENTH